MYKALLILGVLLAAVPVSAQAPVITQTAPVVNQGATLQFTETLSEAGTWSCSGCAGNITSGGLYTAPATVTPQQTIGGYQLLPNQHIYNARVDSLPLRSDSATLMAGTGTGNLIYREIFSFPINYCNGSTPLQALTFNATPGNNGNFQIPAYPKVGIEGGWLSRWNGGLDHHLICVDTTNGTMQEIYQLYPSVATTAASVTGNVATMTLASSPVSAGLFGGVSATIYTAGFTGADTYFNGGPFTITTNTATTISFALTHANASASSNGFVGQDPSNTAVNAGGGIRYLNSTYNLPNTQGGATDAAGLYLGPLSLRVQEMERAIAIGGTIKHALRMTIRNNFICSSSTANACYSGQPGGSRHIWPATAEAFAGGGLNPYGLRYRLKAAYNCAALSSIAQILCTQLKQYGLILSDGGTDWSIIGESGKWPATIIAAFSEMETAAIQGSTNFEVVDESGLQAAANQTCPIPDNCGLTTNNPETVTFTRTSDSMTASVSVALMGVAVNLPNDAIYIQAGTAAQQLTAFVHGGAANTVTWTVSPAITGGSLTSGGLLTPPATIAAVTSYTITATSTDNAAIAAQMALTLYPVGSIFIRPGAPSNFTDSNGNIWTATGGSGDWLGSGGDLSGGPWGALPNKQIYYYQSRPFNDEFFNFSVPNGTYKVTVKLGTSTALVNFIVDTLETQGAVVYANQDVPTLAGGAYKPLDLILNPVVTNGLLSIVIRTPTISGGLNIINAIQIDAATPLGTTLTPGMKVTSGVSIK